MPLSFQSFRGSCWHPSTTRPHCLRSAPIDDGFDRAAPRTRSSPCDPRPAVAGGVVMGVGWLAATEEAGSLGDIAKVHFVAITAGELKPLACFCRRELADHYRHHLDQGSFRSCHRRQTNPETHCRRTTRSFRTARARTVAVRRQPLTA